MKTSAGNITPGKLRIKERKELIEACNHSFLQLLHLLQVKLIIGIGNFASNTASKALKDSQQQNRFPHIRIEKLMHPSPANPAANKGWQGYALGKLKEIGIERYTDWKITVGSQVN